jgi:hypothetical protein
MDSLAIDLEGHFSGWRRSKNLALELSLAAQKIRWCGRDA